MENLMFILTRGRISVKPSEFTKAFGFLGMESNFAISALQCGLCDSVLFAISGADPSQLNYTDLPNIISKGQDNLGWKQVIHYGQNILRCGFHKFDYGARENLRKYGSPEPPQYDLSKVQVPTYIFYGDGDNLITPWVTIAN